MKDLLGTILKSERISFSRFVFQYICAHQKRKSKTCGELMNFYFMENANVH